MLSPLIKIVSLQEGVQNTPWSLKMIAHLDIFLDISKAHRVPQDQTIYFERTAYNNQTSIDNIVHDNNILSLFNNEKWKYSAVPSNGYEVACPHVWFSSCPLLSFLLFLFLNGCHDWDRHWYWHLCSGRFWSDSRKIQKGRSRYLSVESSGIVRICDSNKIIRGTRRVLE